MSEEPIRIGKYRPSNGTEGDIFMDSWCRHCERDKHMSESKDYDECEQSEICQIIGKSLAYDIDHDEYPIEWVWKYNQPTCTAFIQAGEPIPLKDDLTVDMFE